MLGIKDLGPWEGKEEKGELMRKGIGGRETDRSGNFVFQIISDKALADR